MKDKLNSPIAHAALAGAAAAFLVLAAAGGAIWVNKDRIARDFFLKPVETKTEKGATTTPLYPQESLVVEIVKKASPAVVSITVSADVPKLERYFEEDGDAFSDFFGGSFFRFSIPKYRQKGTEKQEISSSSGFLVSPDGYIVTNRHVVDQEKAEYTVFTNDGKKHVAEVVARDPVLDIAVIKIKGKDFPYLSFGESDRLLVGQSVIAIGNALGEFRNTVSVGVISGLGRSVVAGDFFGRSEALDQVIQTDAAINPGNSGGPLLNLRGEVVGVNVAIVAGSQNIGFALPADSVKGVVESFRRYGRIVRPFLGVRYIQVTPSLKEKNKLPVDYGALVIRGESKDELAVIPGSPADKAGITENDIILEVDGLKLDSNSNLAAIIRSKKVGGKIELTIIHKGEKKKVTVTLEEAPD